MHQITKLMHDICDLIMSHLDEVNRLRFEVTTKPDSTLVTKADLYLEKLVHDFVVSNIENVKFIGEETFDFSSVKNEEYIVILDPIDGTENFCSGLKEWGVSFGIWHKESFLGSFILLPELDIRLVSGDKVQYIKNSRLTGISSSMAESLINVMREPGEYRIMGCAVFNLYNVITGVFKRFVNPKGAYVWDILPGLMLALEHGCSIYVDDQPYHGEMLDPTQKHRIDVRHEIK